VRTASLRIAAAALGLLVEVATASAAEPRPILKDVSAIRIANYGSPSTVIEDRSRVNAILGELRQLRAKDWRKADPKLSCYATLVLLRGPRTVALFRIRPELVVERAQEKGQATYSLDTTEADLPKVTALLAAIAPAKDCQ
jgi:hypothetical protein